MERVTFLIESTGQRLGCLLNPATLELTRRAGIRQRRGAAGAIASRGLSDDPLIATGGGVTELKLDLLFDVSVAGSSVRSEDVRDLTRPLWDLAESRGPVEGGRPSVVQFFWGKSEGFPGVVLAVAERLEHFSSEGVPRRCWLRMQMRRMAQPSGTDTRESADPLDGISTQPVATGGGPADAQNLVMGPLAGAAEGLGEPAAQELGGIGRLDSVAAVYFGDASLWRWIAEFNGVDDPARLDPETQLRVPSTPPAGESRR